MITTFGRSSPPRPGKTRNNPLEAPSSCVEGQHRPDQRGELFLGAGKSQPYGTDQFWAWYQLLRQRYRQFRESFDPSVIPEEVGIAIELSIMQGVNIHSSPGRGGLIQSVLLQGKIESLWSKFD